MAFNSNFAWNIHLPDIQSTMIEYTTRVLCRNTCGQSRLIFNADKLPIIKMLPFLPDNFILSYNSHWWFDSSDIVVEWMLSEFDNSKYLRWGYPLVLLMSFFILILTECALCENYVQSGILIFHGAKRHQCRASDFKTCISWKIYPFRTSIFPPTDRY